MSIKSCLLNKPAAGVAGGTNIIVKVSKISSKVKSLEKKFVKRKKKVKLKNSAKKG